MGWDVNVQLHLRHEVHITSRMGWGGIGMLTSSCTCVMTLMLRHGWGGMLTSSCTWLVSCGLWSFERRQQLAERVKKKCCSTVISHAARRWHRRCARNQTSVTLLLGVARGSCQVYLCFVGNCRQCVQEAHRPSCNSIKR